MHKPAHQRQNPADREPIPRAMYTVAEFCQMHAISRSKFYTLVAEGRGPTLSKVGRRTLISAEAAEKWRRDMERPIAPPASRAKPAPAPRPLTDADAQMVAAEAIREVQAAYSRKTAR